MITKYTEIKDSKFLIEPFHRKQTTFLNTNYTNCFLFKFLKFANVWYILWNKTFCQQIFCKVKDENNAFQDKKWLPEPSQMNKSVDWIREIRQYGGCDREADLRNCREPRNLEPRMRESGLKIGRWKWKQEFIAIFDELLFKKTILVF